MSEHLYHFIRQHFRIKVGTQREWGDSVEARERGELIPLGEFYRGYVCLTSPLLQAVRGVG